MVFQRKNRAPLFLKVWWGKCMDFDGRGSHSVTITPLLQVPTCVSASIMHKLVLYTRLVALSWTTPIDVSFLHQALSGLSWLYASFGPLKSSHTRVPYFLVGILLQILFSIFNSFIPAGIWAKYKSNKQLGVTSLCELVSVVNNEASLDHCLATEKAAWRQWKKQINII